MQTAVLLSFPAFVFSKVLLLALIALGVARTSQGYLPKFLDTRTEEARRAALVWAIGAIACAAAFFFSTLLNIDKEIALGQSLAIATAGFLTTFCYSKAFMALAKSPRTEGTGAHQGGAWVFFTVFFMLLAWCFRNRNNNYR